MEDVVRSGQFIVEQKGDPERAALLLYMAMGELTKASTDACRMVVLELFFSVESGRLQLKQTNCCPDRVESWRTSGFRKQGCITCWFSSGGLARGQMPPPPPANPKKGGGGCQNSDRTPKYPPAQFLTYPTSGGGAPCKCCTPPPPPLPR